MAYYVQKIKVRYEVLVLYWRLGCWSPFLQWLFTAVTQLWPATQHLNKSLNMVQSVNNFYVILWCSSRLLKFIQHLVGCSPGLTFPKCCCLFSYLYQHISDSGQYSPFHWPGCSTRVCRFCRRYWR